MTAGLDGDLYYSFTANHAAGFASVGPDGTQRGVWPEPFGTEGPDAGMAFDAAGNLWGGAVTEPGIQRLPLAASIPGPLQPVRPRTPALKDPYSLVAATDGTMWLTTNRGIVRVGPSGPARVFGRGIARRAWSILPAGHNVWFTYGANGIARLNPDGSIRRFTRGFPRRAQLSQLVRGPDGNLWFIDHRRHTIGRMTPSGHVREFRRGLGRTNDLLVIATGPDRRVWATDQDGSIDAITPTGHVRRYTRGLGRHAEPPVTQATAAPSPHLLGSTRQPTHKDRSRASMGSAHREAPSGGALG